MILQGASLVGRITAQGCLSASVNIGGSLVGALVHPKGYADYKGAYEVTPKVTEQSLKTKDKHMTDDVKIKSIPFFNVSNTSGGSTAYIGSEV